MTADTQEPRLQEPELLQPQSLEAQPTALKPAPHKKANPWSVKGVSGTARQAARDAADAAGMNLGEWLNQVIVLAHEPPPAPPVTMPLPVEHNQPPSDAAIPPSLIPIIPQVAEAITALENRIVAAQQNVSGYYAPLRSTVEVLGVRVGALERVGNLTEADTSAATREQLARRLSGQGPVRPSAEDTPGDAKALTAPTDRHSVAQARGRRTLRRVVAVASVFVIGASAAYIAIWFSLLAGPSNPRQITAALPVEALAPTVEPGQEAATAPVTDDEVLQLRLQAEAGSPAAQLQLANIYLQGTGVDQDYAAAAQWLQASAERGNAVAQYSLGVLNERGLGVRQDADAAALWYGRAARQQQPNAQYALGIAFLEGRGKPQDYQEAAIWLERAARQDIGDAQYAYAVMLEDGLIGPPDTTRAYEWYQAAIANGSTQAAERAALLVPRLVTPSSESTLPSIPAARTGSADATDRVLILQIEQLLSTLDFNVGTPDGILAGQTVAAIEEYQAALELPVDGRPSQQLLDHLKSITGS